MWQVHPEIAVEFALGAHDWLLQGPVGFCRGTAIFAVRIDVASARAIRFCRHSGVWISAEYVRPTSSMVTFSREVHDMKLYGSLAGFAYYIKPAPFLGAFVAMQTFARGLLRYGDFDEYHAYHTEEFLKSFTEEETVKAYFQSEKLKIKRLDALVRNADIPYRVLHCETCDPRREVVLRGMLSNKRVPLTRRMYAVATNAHLMQLLDICALGGGRPYDSIVVPSQPTRDAILAYYDDAAAVTAGRLCYRGRVDVIPHGVDLEAFSPCDRQQIRRELGIPPGAIVFLSMARIARESKMNYSQLLDFFSCLEKTIGTAHELFYILAGADHSNQMQELLRRADALGIATRMKTVTDFTEGRKRDILGGADIFISLGDNLQESFGITLVEAMAMRLPVICTDWDGYKDIVQNGLTGYRIPTLWKVRRCPEDVLVCFQDPYDHTVLYRISQDIHIDMQLLLGRAEELVRSEGRRRTLGENGRRAVEARYSIKTEIDQFRALWQELGEMAQRDEKTYEDTSRLLMFDYPRHFRGYPTVLHQE